MEAVCITDGKSAWWGYTTGQILEPNANANHHPTIKGSSALALPLPGRGFKSQQQRTWGIKWEHGVVFLGAVQACILFQENHHHG